MGRFEIVKSGNTTKNRLVEYFNFIAQSPCINILFPLTHNVEGNINGYYAMLRAI